MAARSFDELLEQLAARTPAPGGGSACAWAAALAAALVEMAASFAGAVEVGERAGALRARALELAEVELGAYAPVLEAQRLPVDDPSRPERVAAALSAAAESPLEIARVAAEVASLADELVATGNSSLEGDAYVAVRLARGACAGAARLVELNLAGTPEDPRLAEARSLAALS